MTLGRSSEQRERMARRSSGEARRYRQDAALLSDWSAEGQPHYDPTRKEQGVRSRIRAALGHEVWAEHLLGRLSWDEFMVDEKMLPTWQGESLADFLDAIRAVAA